MLTRALAILTSLLILGGSLPANAQTLDKAERACASSKLKATAKKAGAKLKCEAQAIVKELGSADAECLSKAEEKFLLAFSKAEEKGGCVSEADAVAVEAVVDAFVQGEVTRQKTGGGNLPSCSAYMTACGSCGGGGGMCLYHQSDMSLVCVSPDGVVPMVCASDAQCTSPMICANASGSTACVNTCP